MLLCGMHLKKMGVSLEHGKELMAGLWYCKY
jgi:hypothetical protein